MSLENLETPCVLIDLDKVEGNLSRAQDYAKANGLTLRPHIKTHKLPRFARRQIELGAVGITCQKLGEVEVMADAGITDIFMPYNIVGEGKLRRLKALAARLDLKVTADSAFTVEGYARTFRDADRPLPVLVECDTGMHRCGVATPQDAVALARLVAASPGLEFAGLMTYPATGKYHEALDWLVQAVEALKEAGLPPRIVSSGGTPDLFHAHEAAHLITEYRPGTYIYSDRFQVSRGIGSMDECALTVLATVISAPAPDRVVIDAGSKALTSDLLGMDGFGYLPAYPEARIASLSEEHGVIDVSACTVTPRIGERIEIIPNHACPVSNLFDRVNLVRGGDWVESVPVAARGRVD